MPQLLNKAKHFFTHTQYGRLLGGAIVVGALLVAPPLVTITIGLIIGGQTISDINSSRKLQTVGVWSKLKHFFTET
jgi:hypothetical protein